MQRNKIIGTIAWLRVLVFTASLFVLSKSDTFAETTQSYMLANAKPLLILSGAFLLATLVPNILFKLCSSLWNKITPLKNRPTFIETEIVYLISVVPAISLILLVLLKAPLTSALILLGFVFAAALPAAVTCYLACRLFLKSATETAEIAAETAEADVKNELERDVLEAPENTLIPFFLSALIFAISISVMVTTAVLMRGGGFQLKIFTSVMGLSAVTIMLLTVFGQSALNFGASIQKCLGVRPFTSRRGIATAWTLGIMVSTTVFILIFSSNRLPTTLSGWVESWSLLVTYGIITLGCLLSGIALSLFYKKKSLSGVFT